MQSHSKTWIYYEIWLHSYITWECAWAIDPRLNTVHLLLSPVECMGLCDGPVQATGCPVTDQLEQKHHAIICVLGNC